MYRRRRRFHHHFGIRLQRPTVIPSSPSGPGPCVPLSAFLVLPHPSQSRRSSEMQPAMHRQNSCRTPKRTAAALRRQLGLLLAPPLDW